MNVPQSEYLSSEFGDKITARHFHTVLYVLDNRLWSLDMPMHCCIQILIITKGFASMLTSRVTVNVGILK